MNVVTLHAGNPGPMTGSGNWTYLVPVARPVLVDAGVSHESHLDGVFALAPAARPRSSSRTAIPTMPPVRPSCDDRQH